MDLNDALARVMREYRTATTQPFGGHTLGAFVRAQARDAVRDALGSAGRGLIIEGSAGAGNWATVPWVSIFDPAVTDTATRGYYVVYLFHSSEPLVHLSLNQGTTRTREEFGAQARQVLADRAALMRRRLLDFADVLSVRTIDLGSPKRLPADYVAGHALGRTYKLDALPAEAELRGDLDIAIRAYRALTFRGGLDAAPELSGEVQDELGGPDLASLVEIRRYKLHRRIERNPQASKAAKRLHGKRCQTCDLDFGEVYGPLGAGFIEAHHLKPVASLEEGAPVEYELATDFAVLCSNCHRMIHRTADPSDLEELRAIIRDLRQGHEGKIGSRVVEEAL